jgi:hypothetical protein
MRIEADVDFPFPAPSSQPCPAAGKGAQLTGQLLATSLVTNRRFSVNFDQLSILIGPSGLIDQKHHQS